MKTHNILMVSFNKTLIIFVRLNLFVIAKFSYSLFFSKVYCQLRDIQNGFLNYTNI